MMTDIRFLNYNILVMLLQFFLTFFPYEIFVRPRSLVSFTLEKFGKLDFLVNNGGGQFPCGAADMSLKGQSGILNFPSSRTNICCKLPTNPGWNAVVETNLTGTYLMCREAHRQHMGEHGGSIVNIIADMLRGFPMMAHTGQTLVLVGTGATMFLQCRSRKGRD